MMERIIRLGFLLFLSLTISQAYGQYPATGNKQRLGYQTTGDGLVFRGNGAPAYTPTGLNNAWTYLDTVSRNIYTYVGGTWRLITGGGSAFDGYVDSLVFNQSATVMPATGKMYWDANSETISVGVDGGAVYQMGEELFYPLVINKSGATILNGQLVMVDTATLVTGDHVRIILARNGATYPSNYIMGVATTNIPNDSTGLVTWFGYVREVKHADIAQTGVTLVPGNILYASATEPGRYTNVAPTTPAHKSTIALVVRKPSDNNMTLLVRPWLAPRLADLSDVNTSSVTGLSVLRYNSTTGIWDASATPGIVAADTSAMLAGYVRGSATSGQITFWNGTRNVTGSSGFLWDNTNSRLNIGSATNINYALNWDRSTDQYFRAKFKNTSTNTNALTILMAMNANGSSIDLVKASNDYTLGGYLANEGAVSSNNGGLLLNAGTSAASPIRFSTNLTERARFLADGKFVIGGTTGDSTFNVVGGANFTSRIKALGSQVILASDTFSMLLPYMKAPTGTGLLKSVSGTITYVTDNSTDWNTAANDRVTVVAVTGTTTKTVTLLQADGGNLATTFTDLNSGGTVTSVATGWGLAGGTITTTGTVRADSNAVASVYANSLKLNKSDTAAMLLPYAKDSDLAGYVSGSGLASYIPQWTGTGTMSFTNAYYTSNNWGFNTATPARRVDVNGTVRIRTLVTDNPTRIVGADADGDLNQIKLGAGLVLNTDTLNLATVASSVFQSINAFSPSQTVSTGNGNAFFLVPASLNGWCIDDYQVEALSGTGTASVAIRVNSTNSGTQSISGTTTYNVNTNIALATGDIVTTAIGSTSGTLTGLGITLVIKQTCN